VQQPERRQTVVHLQALRGEGHEQCGCPHSLVLHPSKREGREVMIRRLVVSLCDIYINAIGAVCELCLDGIDSVQALVLS
jgi:hypothetical protein